MPRQLDVTQDQTIATRRHDLEGAVYVLSGTLPGRRVGISGIDFLWSTLTFSGALGEAEQYINPPKQILRAQAFLPGAGAQSPAVRIPVRNLKFGEADSLFAAIDDGVYAWEEAEVSLRVGYLKPGQTAPDLVSGDWTYLIKDGFFSAPEDVSIDGFVLPIYSRGAQRDRAFKQPRLPGDVGLISGAIETRDLGAVNPVVIGKPASWYQPPTADIGIRGFTTSAFVAGATQIEVALITDGQHEGKDTGIPTGLSSQTLYGDTISGGNVFWIHRQNPVYLTSGASTIYNRASGLLTLTLQSGLIADTPRGALVQEHMRYRSGSDSKADRQLWCLAAHQLLNFDTSADISQGDLEGNIGFVFADGTIKIADPDVWEFNTENNTVHDYSAPFEVDTFNGATFLRRAENSTWLDDRGTINTSPPVFFDPDFGIASVTQQPTFTATARLTSKLNYPTGGTGSNNANARDGSPETGASLTVGSVITLTFNSVASPFVDSDTDLSVLHVTVQGNIIFTDAAGSITFATAAGTGGTNKTFRFSQATARDYNETVRCVGDTGGGTVVEVSWEHDLSATETSARTADVELSSGPGGAVGGITLGAPMEYSHVVVRIPGTKSGIPGTAYDNRTSSVALSRYFFEEDPEDHISDGPTTSGNSTAPSIAYPTSTMVALQSIYLGNRFGSFLDVNSGVYRTAHERYKTLDYRWGFVLQRELRSWTELERDLAQQARAQMYYGPSGHEIVVMEGPTIFQQSGAVAEFRMPGVPGTNSTRPRISRTRPDEIINSVRIRWDEDYISGGGLRRTASGVNAASSAIYGERRDSRKTDMDFWAWSPWETHPSFDAAAGVSGIASLFADRGAFGVTRFEFDTAWIAHGVERASPVRVVYPVASGVYRNVICEVERIGVDPISAERFAVVCRAVTTPTEGLPAFTWEEVFTVQGDLWTDRVTTESMIWTDKWSI